MEGYFVIFLVISIVLFIIGRELVLWYWKIHEIVGLLKRMVEALEANARTN